MGLTQTHGLSREMRFYSVTEAVAGTWDEPVGADAAKVMKCDISAERTRNPREDSRNVAGTTTRSLLERIQGRGTVSWSVEAEVIPSGSAGTDPDLGPLYEAAMGTVTNPASTSRYALTNSQSPPTVTLLRGLPGVMSESAWGCWVDEMTLSVQSGETPKVKFAGGAMGYVLTGTSTLNGQMSASTTMIVQTADAYAFGVNSFIDIDAATAVVVTVASSRPSFTVDESVSEADASTVIPSLPTETTAGSPIAGISGSVTYDSDSVNVTGLEVSLKNNFRPLDDEALAEYPSDFVPGYRDVTGNITLRARKDWVVHLANRLEYSTQALTVVLGSVAGSILTVSVPQAELDYSAVDIPAGDGDVVMTLPFVGLASSAEDELLLTFS
jgi:hypothetical protein